MTEGHKGGFWTTLPGVLTGLAALISALTGAALLMRGDGPAPAPTAAAQGPSVGASKAEPANVQAATVDAEPPAVAAAAPAAESDPVAAQVKAAAAELDAKSPYRVNALMTLTGASAQGRMVTMDYAFAQRTAEDDELRSALYLFACNDPATRAMLGLGVTLRMRMRFPDEAMPLDVDVAQVHCTG
ncbi:MAG TPA: hypothetical protein VFZ91_06160 [Allosphingosinicella sp.]